MKFIGYIRERTKYDEIRTKIRRPELNIFSINDKTDKIKLNGNIVLIEW